MTGLLISLILPWILGALWLSRFWSSANTATLLGYGYLFGILLITTLMRLWDFMGLEIQFWPIAGVSLVAAMLAFLVPKPAADGFSGIDPPGQQGAAQTPAAESQKILSFTNFIFAIFLVLVVVRLGAMLADNVYRPMFSWDTWMNFAPKARVWFELHEIVPYVSPRTWLAGTYPEAYTLGNSQAWDYPLTVPLVMFWTALGLDAWHDDLIKIPWVLGAAALGLGVYGQLRHFGVARHLALIFVYLLLSIPYLNVHVTLAGYADFWLAIFLCLGLLALLKWCHTHDRADLAIAIIFALFCFTIKRPGAIWGGILLVSIALAMMPRRWAIALILVMVAAPALVWTLGGIDVRIPGLGRLQLNSSGISLPYLGSQDIQFTDITKTLDLSLLRSPNWNMLWYAMPVGILIGVIWRPGRLRQFAPFFFLIASVAAFLFIFFMIPRYSSEATNQTTLNRALLHLVPAYFSLIIWWLWGKNEIASDEQSSIQKTT